MSTGVTLGRNRFIYVYVAARSLWDELGLVAMCAFLGGRAAVESSELPLAVRMKLKLWFVFGIVHKASRHAYKI